MSIFDIQVKNTYKIILTLAFSLFFFFLTSSTSTVKACDTTYCTVLPNGACVEKGGNGCAGSCPCYSGYFCYQGFICCDSGPCIGCTPPSCDANYSETSTSCGSYDETCTKRNCPGEACGTNTRTCYLVDNVVTYSGNGGTCTPTSRTVCYNGTSAAPTCTRTGYNLTGFTRTYLETGGGGTVNTSTGAVTGVTGDQTITANWVINNQAPTAPTSLQTEGATNPTRVADTTPEFSAIYNDTVPSGDTAVYYQIQVNTSSAFTGTSMWDSGKTSMTSTSAGSRSPQISYAGTTLSLNGSTYYWRVKFWDVNNAEGAWSTETASFTMNRPPSAPTSPQTELASNPTGVTDTRPDFRAIFQDPDSGDTGTYYEIEVNTNSSFTGTVMWDSGQVSMSSVAIGSYSAEIEYGAASALTLDGTTYYWRIRFTDNHGTTGSWSATSQFTMNTPPSSPSDPRTEGLVNPINVVDLTPEFTAVFQDNNVGDTGVYYEINVNTNSSFTGTVMWNSGQQSMTATAIGATSPQISYAGSALSYNGTIYYWRIRFTDNRGTVGSWSATANFTMNNKPSAPTVLQTEGLTNPQNVSDMTPEFSALFQDTNSGQTGLYYQIQVNTDSDFTGTSMWDSGKTSMTSTAIGVRSPQISYAGTGLTQSGTLYYWRIKFWDSLDAEGDWSSAANFRVQRAPSAPTVLHTDGMVNPGYVLTLTPSLSAIYNDVNGHSATAYEIEVNTNSSFTGTVMWDTGKTATSVTEGARSPQYTYAGTALQSDNTTYYWRIRFWDADDLQGDWSATNTFVSRLNRQLLKGLLLKGLRVN